MCGNIVMKGYLKNFSVIEEVFVGGWFYIGDLVVCYLDGYIEICDWFKDIIIFGGENIFIIELEGVFYCYLVVLEVVVVVWFDEKWGEMFCVFIILKSDY